jgi:hypothetical protein
MFRLSLAAAGLLAICQTAAAQHTHGYVFAGAATIPGRSAFTFWQGDYVTLGGGGEGALGRRCTVGGEASALLSRQALYGRSAGVFSVGPAFHFLPRGERKLDPFVNGGFALLAANGAGAMFYFGGGANYWFHRRIGLRFEFRDQVWTPEAGERIQFVGGRFGVSFR